MADPSIVCIVPTRNRPELAIKTVQSIISQTPQTQIVVSDNSTDAGARFVLAHSCANLPSTRVHYVRPPEPLEMSAHWSWALQQALNYAELTHVSFVTDRMVFRPGELLHLVNVVKQYPDRVVSYNHDIVHDERQPVRLTLFPWTGQLFMLSSRHLLWISSRGMIHWSLPRMLNCVVPRGVLDAMTTKFGSVFDSVSPDFCFAFRCLEIVDDLLYLDRTVLVAHSIGRSNGASYARGLLTRDRVDFARSLGEKQMNSEAPVPEFQTIRNAILNEYCFVQKQVCSDKFPPVDPRSYLAAIVEDFSLIEDPRVQSAMISVLGDTGWVAGPRARLDAAMGLLRLLFLAWDVMRLTQILVLRCLGLVLSAMNAGPLRCLETSARSRLRLFASSDDALEFAKQTRGLRLRSVRHLAALLGPPGSFVPVDLSTN